MTGLHLEGTASIDGTTVFDGVALPVVAGRWTCLLGRSGVGKSTIMRLIAGLADHVRFTGRIDGDDGEQLDQRITLMAQQDSLLPWLSTIDNVLLGARLRGQRLDRDRARQLIDQVGLGAHLHKKPHALSGGQRQRVALARTLMEDRPLVLLDEPFSALDARVRAEMQELAAEQLVGRTVLLVTHDPGEAARLSDNIHVMTSTGLITVEPPSTPVVRAYDDAEVLACQGRLLRLLREAS
jgi:putative hydroxymethylpyrimidine transport system ATP-binding protein